MWRPNPARIWRDVSETANRADRLERVKQAQAYARALLDSLRGEAEALASGHARYDNHPGSEPGAMRSSARLMFVAVVLLALDVPVQYLLNSAALPGVAGWKVLAGSVALPIGIAAIIHYILEPLVYDAARPARSIRMAKRLAASTLLAEVAGATVFLFARQASGEIAGYIVSLTSTSLWAVAEALPLTAGFVAMWAHMLAKPSLDAARFQVVKERIATWERLSERLSVEAESISATEESPNRRTDRLEPVRLTSALVILIVFGGVVPKIAHAQSNRTCAVFVDRSRSVDSVHRVTAVRMLLDALPTILNERGCTTVIAGTFANEGSFAPRTLLAVPERYVPKDCQRVTMPALSGARTFLVGMQGFRDHFRRRAVESCEKNETARRTQYERRWAEFRGGIAVLLSEPPVDRETKTDIIGLVTSLRAIEVSFILLVTDALHTAHTTHDRFAPMPKRDLQFVLVPAAAAYGGPTATLSASVQWEHAGALTIPYTALVAAR